MRSFPFIATSHEDFATQRSGDALGHIDRQGEFHCTLTEPRRRDLVPGRERVTAVPLFRELTCNTKDLKNITTHCRFYKHSYLKSLSAGDGRLPAKPMEIFAAGRLGVSSFTNVNVRHPPQVAPALSRHSHSY